MISAIWLLILPVGPLAGSFLAIQTTKKFEGKLKLFLSFAGAYLLGVTLLNLIPEVFQVFDSYKGLLVLLGFFFQVFLERYSEGIEHGHFHGHHHLRHKAIPVGIVASMSIHSFTEGIPVGALWASGNSSFYTILFGILIHEVPAAFTLISLLKGLQIRSSNLVITALIYSMMALTGSVLSIVLEASVDESFFDYFMAFVIGTFLHISTTILFENSEGHYFSRNKLIAVLLGIGLAYLVSVL